MGEKEEAYLDAWAVQLGDGDEALGNGRRLDPDGAVAVCQSHPCNFLPVWGHHSQYCGRHLCQVISPDLHHQCEWFHISKPWQTQFQRSALSHLVVKGNWHTFRFEPSATGIAAMAAPLGSAMVTVASAPATGACAGACCILRPETAIRHTPLGGHCGKWVPLINSTTCVLLQLPLLKSNIRN